MLVGNPASRAEPVTVLRELGFSCEEADDPYSAFAELCRRPLAFSAVVLSLSSLYREELQIVPSIRQRFPHLDVWLAQAEGRQAAMAEALQLGADGLLSRDGLHRIGLAGQPPGNASAAKRAAPQQPQAADAYADDDDRQSADAASETDEFPGGEPVLTAEELRALLQEPREDPTSVDEGR